MNILTPKCLPLKQGNYICFIQVNGVLVILMLFIVCIVTELLIYKTITCASNIPKNSFFLYTVACFGGIPPSLESQYTSIPLQTP
jgi:hypothetical protein